MSTVIVGVGGLLRDAACCVVKDGCLVSAVEQGKIARQQRGGWFPEEAFAAALRLAGVDPKRIDQIAVARPLSEGSEAARLLALRQRFPASEVVVVEHHRAHAASAYYASGFDEAAVLSADRSGDYRSAVLFQGEGTKLTPLRELYFPDSLGDLFNRVTELLGFKPQSDEHKVQWLSTFGVPHYRELFDQIVQAASPWGRFSLEFFDAGRLTQGGFSSQFYQALGTPNEDGIAHQMKADIAASLQACVDGVVAGMLGGSQNVCLAGGLGLNALLIHSLEQHFRNVFVQPAAGNAGTSIGAALAVLGQQFPFRTLSLGPSYDPTEIKSVLENCKLNFRFLTTEGELIQSAVRSLTENKIVGWMQGRMEFGPRALGNRSILASPLNPYSTENLNIYIKHREEFRKFAASVPAEHAERYFEVSRNAHYLATVGRLRREHLQLFAAARLGADLIRVHTVDKEENPLFHALLLAAGEATGVPVLYNTSFNLFGDSMVCTPRDAVRSFYSSGIDALFVGNFSVEK